MPGEDGVLHRGNVGVAAEDLGVGGDEVPVQVGKQLVAVEPADHCEDARHLRIGEGRVQVRDPRSHRRGFEVVSLIDVLGEGQPQAQGGKASIDHAAVIVLGHELAAAAGATTRMVSPR